jgi:hypothetical protein
VAGHLDKGVTIFARIDHAEAARNAGLAMPPTQVLIYGNAKGGTPLMLGAPSIALDLPLRVLVRDDCQGQHLSELPHCRGTGKGSPLTLRESPAQVASQIGRHHGAADPASLKCTDLFIQCPHDATLFVVEHWAVQRSMDVVQLELRRRARQLSCPKHGEPRTGDLMAGQPDRARRPRSVR